MSKPPPRRGRNFRDEPAPHEKSVPKMEVRRGPARLRASSRVAADWILRAGACDATATFPESSNTGQPYTKTNRPLRKDSLRLSGFSVRVKVLPGTRGSVEP